VASVLLLSAPLFFVGARAHALLFEARLPFMDVVREPSLLFQPGWRLPGGLALGAVCAPAREDQQRTGHPLESSTFLTPWVSSGFAKAMTTRPRSMRIGMAS